MLVGDFTFIKEVFTCCKGKRWGEGEERGPSVMLVRLSFSCTEKGLSSKFHWMFPFTAAAFSAGRLVIVFVPHLSCHLPLDP